MAVRDSRTMATAACQWHPLWERASGEAAEGIRTRDLLHGKALRTEAKLTAQAVIDREGSQGGDSCSRKRQRSSPWSTPAAWASRALRTESQPRRGSCSDPSRMLARSASGATCGGYGSSAPPSCCRTDGPSATLPGRSDTGSQRSSPRPSGGSGAACPRRPPATAGSTSASSRVGMNGCHSRSCPRRGRRSRKSVRPESLAANRVPGRR